MQVVFHGQRGSSMDRGQAPYDRDDDHGDDEKRRRRSQLRCGTKFLPEFNIHKSTIFLSSNQSECGPRISMKQQERDN